MSAAGPRRAFALPFPLLLALRYLRSTRRDAYVTFLSLLAGGGIALGVAALVLVLAALSGLQDFLRRDVLARTPHLEIALPRGADAAAVRAAVAAVPGVVAVHRYVRGRGWLRGGSRVIDVAVVGFEGELPAFFPEASAGRASAGRASAGGPPSLVTRPLQVDLEPLPEGAASLPLGELLRLLSRRLDTLHRATAGGTP